MIKVRNREAAWKEAERLFPTDWEKDERATANAGYPIYMSAAEGNNSWISDLNTSLELNIQEGKGIKTIRIYIEQEPEIIEETKWDPDSIRCMCIKHNLYTCGTVSDYNFMLNTVGVQDPTVHWIYEIAQDIVKHSKDQTVENVMFLIRKEAVDTFYTIK